MTSPAPDIRCVCFDWGGVILRICRSWAQGCQRAGLPLRGDLSIPAWANERKGASFLYQTGQIADDDYFSRISQGVGGLYTPDECRRVHDAWLIEEYPGAAALVEDLNASPRLTTALLSNTNPSHWRRQHADPTANLPHYPTASRLRLRHASHLLGLAKPDAEIYRAFERETSLRPSQILFFDDLADNVAGATSRGWLAHQIDHTADPPAQIRAHLASLHLLPRRDPRS